MKKPEISDLWKQIRERPGLYLGSSSISALYHFLAGWAMATSYHRVEGETLEVPMDFHEWVAYREHFYESTSGWCQMLLARCNDEEAALKRFFDLRDEYLCRQAREFAYISGYRRQTERQVDGRWERLEHVGKLSLLTYTTDPGFFTHFSAPDWGLRDDYHADADAWMTFGMGHDQHLTILDQTEYDRVITKLPV